MIFHNYPQVQYTLTEYSQKEALKLFIVAVKKILGLPQ